MRFEEVETSSQETSDGQLSDFRFRTYPQGSAQLLPEEGAYVTGFTFVSPIVHAEEPKPPSLGRGGAEGDGG